MSPESELVAWLEGLCLDAREPSQQTGACDGSLSQA